MKKITGHFFALCAILLAVFSCGRGSSNRSQEGAAPSWRKVDFTKGPDIPSLITEPSERIFYYISHFWDEFLDGAYPCDSSHVNGVPAEDVETALGKYISIMEKSCPDSVGKVAIGDLFRKVERFGKGNPGSNVFPFFEKMVSKYLYDPNSPVRDEDLYLPFVSGLAASSLVDEGMKPSYSFDERMCSLNQVGTQAADIVFTDIKGRRRSLYGIKADHTLLFFTNPGCQACQEIIREIGSSRRLTTKIDSGELAVVNVYIDGDVEKWRQHAGEYPSAWYSGYDQDGIIRQDVTYNVRAIPSLYVLDAGKKVVLKDAPRIRVMDYLEDLK